MTPIIVTVLGFILTGIIGNQLIQKWQYRGWIRQQRFSGAEKEYIALRDLVSSLSTEIGKRLFRSKRLFYAIRSSDQGLIKDRLAAYDESVVSWNEQLNGFASRLTILSSFDHTTRMEREIERGFQGIGYLLERLTRQRLSGASPLSKDLKTVNDLLNAFQARAATFDRDMLQVVNEARKKTYFGSSLRYSPYTLHRMSTIELVKAIFVSDVDSHTVSRAP